MFSCMPFLAPVLVKNSHTLKQSFHTIIPFSLGRVFSYTLIAISAMGAASFVKNALNDNAVFQTILGVFTLFMGFTMLYKTLKQEQNSCAATPNIEANTKQTFFSLFSIGALLALNPCTPLLTLIALSANATSFAHASGMGLFFGVGAVMVPTLFYGFFLSTLIRGLLVEFKTHAKKIEIAAALLLMVVGVFLLNNQISL